MMRMMSNTSKTMPRAGLRDQGPAGLQSSLETDIRSKWEEAGGQFAKATLVPPSGHKMIPAVSADVH